MEKLGYPVPKFDFRCPGVTSMAADAHKWGYCCKVSLIYMYLIIANDLPIKVSFHFSLHTERLGAHAYM